MSNCSMSRNVGRQMANAKTKDLGHKLVHANTVFACDTQINKLPLPLLLPTKPDKRKYHRQQHNCITVAAPTTTTTCAICCNTNDAIRLEQKPDYRGGFCGLLLPSYSRLPLPTLSLLLYSFSPLHFLPFLIFLLLPLPLTLAPRGICTCLAAQLGHEPNGYLSICYVSLLQIVRIN